MSNQNLQIILEDIIPRIKRRIRNFSKIMGLYVIVYHILKKFAKSFKVKLLLIYILANKNAAKVTFFLSEVHPSPSRHERVTRQIYSV